MTVSEALDKGIFSRIFPIYDDRPLDENVRHQVVEVKEWLRIASNFLNVEDIRYIRNDCLVTKIVYDNAIDEEERRISLPSTRMMVKIIMKEIEKLDANSSRT